MSRQNHNRVGPNFSPGYRLPAPEVLTLASPVYVLVGLAKEVI